MPKGRPIVADCGSESGQICEECSSDHRSTVSELDASSGPDEIHHLQTVPDDDSSQVQHSPHQLFNQSINQSIIY